MQVVIGVDAVTAEDIVRSAEPFWDAMERAGGGMTYAVGTRKQRHESAVNNRSMTGMTEVLRSNLFQ